MRAAMIESPAFSKRAYTSPMRLLLTPSGLTMERVRSSAIRWVLLFKNGWMRGSRRQARKCTWTARSRQFARRRKCRFGKAFFRDRAALQGAVANVSDREALAAAAFALHVGVAE